MHRPTSSPFATAITLFAALSVVVVLVFLGLQGRNEPSTPALPTGPLKGGDQSRQANTPDWPSLQRYAETLTSQQAIDSLTAVYAAAEEWQQVFQIKDRKLIIRTQATAGEEAFPFISVPLARHASPPPRYWRPAAALAPAPPNKPLQDLHIAIDPGHIGGSWAKMEERWYQIDKKGTEIKEGELTLTTAKLLKPQLEALGAKVTLVREDLEPVTSFRPTDFATAGRSQSEAEKMFYRQAEIRSRAQRINEDIQPDLVLCLHFNAEPWGEPGKATFTDVNHLHLLVNGHYGPGELALDDNRYELLLRLFQRTEQEEIPLSVAVAQSLAAETQLPPYDYNRGHMAGNAHRPTNNAYVWARNLLASRLYQCPVVFCEPYVMNSKEVYDRVTAGDYEGLQPIAGKPRKSLFREYADGVLKGLVRYYQKNRGTTSSL